MIQGGMLPIFFFILKIWRHFFEFSSSQGKRQSLKKTGCSYIFQFFVNPKNIQNCCEMLLCFRRGGHNLGFWGSCTPEPGSSCWSKHRSWQQRRCWKYHTWHWHVWRTYPFKNCYKLNHVLTLWRNRSVTNPQKQTKSVRLMAGSRNCPIGLPLLKSKNTFRFVD